MASFSEREPLIAGPARGESLWLDDDGLGAMPDDGTKVGAVLVRYGL